MKKERLVKRRVVPVVILTVLTLLFTFLMGIRNTMPLDEVVVLFFLDLIFLAVFIYFLEEERLLKQLPTEECNDFKSIAVVYGLGLVAFYISSYLPDYSSFSFCFAAAMAVVANREMALSTGIFLNLLAAYTQLGHPCADGIRFAALIGNDVSVGGKRETFAFMGAIYIIFWYNSRSNILLLCTGLHNQRQSVCACCSHRWCEPVVFRDSDKIFRT